MPFVQGHLRKEPVAITIQSVCEHCTRAIEFEVDNELAFRVEDKADPMIFIPLVDFKKLKDPSIIDAF